MMLAWGGFVAWYYGPAHLPFLGAWAVNLALLIWTHRSDLRQPPLSTLAVASTQERTPMIVLWVLALGALLVILMTMLLNSFTFTAERCASTMDIPWCLPSAGAR